MIAHNPYFKDIFNNAMIYFKSEIRYWVSLSKQEGIPETVRLARLKRARLVSAECREFRK